MKIKYGMYGVGGNPYYGWSENGSNCTIVVTDKYH
jgi:hypothetical protein